jgi:hypothetical protein
MWTIQFVFMLVYKTDLMFYLLHMLLGLLHCAANEVPDGAGRIRQISVIDGWYAVYHCGQPSRLAINNSEMLAATVVG